MFRRNARQWVFGSAVAAIAASVTAWACTTPVYQYALERWPADNYVVTVYVRGALSEPQRAALEVLSRAPSREQAPANVRVERVELAEGQALPAPNATLPWMVVNYPAGRTGVNPVFSGPLTVEAVDALLDSPARREIAKHLISGHCAVWVFAACGNEKKDVEALKTLSAALEEENKTFARAAAEQDVTPEDAPVPGAAFTIVRLSRDDPAERALVTMLLKSEADLGEIKDEPMAFPVFGRGRVLYALAGRGINKDVIDETCGFLTSPCACEIKEENPGTDLLMSADWEKALAGRPMGDDEVPLLAGFFDEDSGESCCAVPAAPAAAVGAALTSGGVVARRIRPSEVGDEAASRGGFNMMVGTLIVLAALAAVVAGIVAALYVRRRARDV
jgi:hypothetical protein